MKIYVYRVIYFVHNFVFSFGLFFFPLLLLICHCSNIVLFGMKI